MRAVLDTNVLVSALIKGGKPRRLLKTLLGPQHAVIVSEPIVEEFSRVSSDARILRYLDEAAASAFLKALLSRAVFVRSLPEVRVLNDPDDKILGTAKAGEADFIVTGDRHMLELHAFGGIRIITVAEALSLLVRKRRQTHE